MIKCVASPTAQGVVTAAWKDYNIQSTQHIPSLGATGVRFGGGNGTGN